MRVVDRHRAPRPLREAGQNLVPGQPGLAVELGRKHLDPRRRGGHPTSQVGGRQSVDKARGIRRPGGARDPEEIKIFFFFFFIFSILGIS